MYRGRFAPSPTGELHLGSAATAVVAWLRCRQANGRFILRIEDIDTPRVIAECERHQIEDLRWLGLDWDEGPDVGGGFGPYRQSQRAGAYEEALRQLADRGLIYLCDCSRKEIAGIASAPHDEDGPRYPGFCRPHGMRARPFRRPPAVRLAVPDRTVEVFDALQGPLRQNVAERVGDFVLKRGDGIYAYQLAVVVDDLAMGVTEVVRGADLLGSAPRQVLLAELLNGTPPSFAHVPLILGEDGQRLEKRNPRHTLRGRRQSGAGAAEVLGQLCRTLGNELRGRTLSDAAQLLPELDTDILRGHRSLVLRD